MYQTVRMVGDTVKEVIASSSPAGEKADSYFNASFILGGQIKGSEPRLFMIYPEGNFIESTTTRLSSRSARPNTASRSSSAPI